MQQEQRASRLRQLHNYDVRGLQLSSIAVGNARQDRRSLAHGLRTGPHQEHQMAFVVHGQLDARPDQAMQHRRPLQVQPPLQRLLALAAAAAGRRRRQVHVDRTPQRELQHRLRLGQRFAAITHQNARQRRRQLGGGQQLCEGGMRALAQRTQRLVFVARRVLVQAGRWHKTTRVC